MFGLECNEREYIFSIISERLMISLINKNNIKSTILLLWYSTRAIFHNTCYIRNNCINCNPINYFNDIDKNENYENNINMNYEYYKII